MKLTYAKFQKLKLRALSSFILYNGFSKEINLLSNNKNLLTVFLKNALFGQSYDKIGEKQYLRLAYYKCQRLFEYYKK